MDVSSLLWQALDEILNHAIELHRIVDEQHVSIAVEPRTLPPCFAFRKSAFGCNAGSYAKSMGRVILATAFEKSVTEIMLYMSATAVSVE